VLALRRIFQSLLPGSQFYFPNGRLGYLWRFSRWQWMTRFGAPASIAERAPERASLTAILLNYRRPENITPLVRVLLRCEFVAKVVVINNNPDYSITRHVRLRERRLELRDNGINVGTVARFDVAKNDLSDYFLSVDDDIFLTQTQISELFAHLVRDPSRPHGVYGQDIRGDGSFIDAIHQVERELDVINRVYAFTPDHVVKFYGLIDRLGISGPDALRGLTSGDDIVLSFAGQGPPMCHNVGEILDCPTEGLSGVAVWREPGFVEFRQRLFRRLQELSKAR
jgi:hypothetical protein